MSTPHHDSKLDFSHVKSKIPKTKPQAPLTGSEQADPVFSASEFKALSTGLGLGSLRPAADQLITTSPHPHISISPSTAPTPYSPSKHTTKTIPNTSLTGTREAKNENEDTNQDNDPFDVSSAIRHQSHKFFNLSIHALSSAGYAFVGGVAWCGGYLYETALSIKTAVVKWIKTHTKHAVDIPLQSPQSRKPQYADPTQAFDHITGSARSFRRTKAVSPSHHKSSSKQEVQGFSATHLLTKLIQHGVDFALATLLFNGIFALILFQSPQPHLLFQTFFAAGWLYNLAFSYGFLIMLYGIGWAFNVPSPGELMWSQWIKRTS